MRSFSLLLIPTLFAVAVASCGYTTGYRMPEGVYQIAVPTFANETFPLRREIEYDITRAVRQELELRTDVQIVPAARADHVLEGTVISFVEGVITEEAFDHSN